LAHNLKLGGPEGQRIALLRDPVTLLRDPLGVGDNLVDLAGETEKLPPELVSLLRWGRLAGQPLFDQTAYRFGTP
jgi:hypothetical protein